MRGDEDNLGWREGDFDPQPVTLLKRGMRGVDVTELQHLLQKNGFPQLKADGDFGGATEKAVRDYQQRAGAVVDGVVGAETLSLLRRQPLVKPLLTPADLAWAAQELGVSVAAVMAVDHVESNGSGFFKDGRAAILFERHVMYRQLKARGIPPDVYMTMHPNVVNTATGGYSGGVAEYTRLDTACTIDRTAALESCSWGSYQIMGYHWKRLGYASVQEFVSLMQTSEGQHLTAFVRFVKLDRRLHTALKERDWAQFARFYNGPGYAKNRYDTKLAAAYAKFQTTQVA